MSSGARAELSPNFHRFTRPNPVAATVFRAVVCSALLLVGLAAAVSAQNTSPTYTARCNDCFALSFFAPGDSGKTAAETLGCQDYPRFNLYENWNDDNPDPIAVAPAALQTNIRFARWASDADYWYFQIETAEDSWGGANGSPVYDATHIEVAFSTGLNPGTCNAGDRFSLLISYASDGDETNVDDPWVNLSQASMTFWRDASTPRNVGGALNDGPLVPLADTTENPCAGTTCDGYETIFSSPPTTAAFARLRDVGGFAVVEIAVDRSDFAGFLGLASFTPCDARFWQTQTSTLDAGTFAWNDEHPDTDLDSSSWAIDNCGTVASVPVELLKFEVD